MNLSTGSAIVSEIVVIGVSVLISWLLLHPRIKRVDDRLNVLLDFLIRRTQSEAVAKGMGSVHSDLAITDEVRGWYCNLAARLKVFYHHIGVRMTNRELFLAIEVQFGDEIVQEVCIPHGLLAGSCILAAITVAREVQPAAPSPAVPADRQPATHHDRGRDAVPPAPWGGERGHH